MTQLKNCIELLIPKPDNFLFAQDENDVDGEENSDIQAHGILNAKTNITIDLSRPTSSDFKETNDNRDICNSLRYAIYVYNFLL